MVNSSTNSSLEAITTLLDQPLVEDPLIWLPVSRELSKGPDFPGGSDVKADLISQSFTWPKASAPLRRRILDAAQRYLRDVDPQNDSWFGTGHFAAAAVAGFRALRFLLEADPSRLDSLTGDELAKWIPIVLVFPASLVSEAPAAAALCRYVYRREPTALLEHLQRAIRSEDKAGPIFVIQRIESSWDDELARTVLNLVREGSLNPGGVATLLKLLISLGSQDAITYAEGLLESPGTADQRKGDFALAAAGALMTATRDADWTKIWRAILADEAFGRELVLAEVSASESDTIRLEQKLSEQQLAEFYSWLVRAFPYSEDPQERGFHYVGTRESAAHLRDGILRHLQARGTEESVMAIRQLLRQHPELPWLARVLREAEVQYRRTTWNPTAPRRLLQLADSAERRMVTAGTQLLNVIEESVQRFEEKLQRETPLAFLLWNELPGRKFRPKEEAGLSDFLKAHLQDDLVERLVIVNREVEVRRRQGAMAGQVTDIHVAATLIGPRERGIGSILAIIEVKGCWNRELLPAMRTQLRDRYLVENQTRYGLYVVGWFGREEWDADDPRRAQVPDLSLVETRARLSEEASNLSSESATLKAFVIDCRLH